MKTLKTLTLLLAVVVLAGCGGDDSSKNKSSKKSSSKEVTDQTTIFKTEEGYYVHSYSLEESDGKIVETGPYKKLDSSASAEEIGNAIIESLDASMKKTTKPYNSYKERISEFVNFTGKSSWDELRSNSKSVLFYRDDEDKVTIISFQHYTNTNPPSFDVDPVFDLEEEVNDPGAKLLGKKVLEKFDKIPEPKFSQEIEDLRKKKEAKRKEAMEDLPAHLQHLTDTSSGSGFDPLSPYEKKGDKVYYNFGKINPDNTEHDGLIEEADAETFQSLNKIYAKDKNNAYFASAVLEGIEAESFEIIDDENNACFVFDGIFARSGDKLIHEDQSISGVDFETYKLFKKCCGYATDKNKVYYNASIVEGADPETFKVSPVNSSSAEDKNGRYIDGKKVN